MASVGLASRRSCDKPLVALVLGLMARYVTSLCLLLMLVLLVNGNTEQEEVLKEEAEQGDTLTLTWLPKCCPLDQVFDEVSGECEGGAFQRDLVEVWHQEEVVPQPLLRLRHDQLSGDDCLGQGRRLLVPGWPEDDYRLLEAGHLLLTSTGRTYTPDQPQQFCVEMFRHPVASSTLQVAPSSYTAILVLDEGGHLQGRDPGPLARPGHPAL